MGKEDIKETLREMISDILETEPEEITDDAHFVDDLGMDSMMALEILAGIEKKFRIVVPEEKLTRLTSLNRSVALVQEILGK